MFNKDILTSKSFITVGKNLDTCYNCSYCRARTNDIISYETFPKVYDSLPLSVNMFYGDPMIQINDTVRILERLEELEYKGIVMIITKGDLKRFPKTKFDLDIHFGLSTFGKDSPYDGSKTAIFCNNMDIISKLGYRFNVEYRPIIKDINDDDTTIRFVTDIAADYDVPIGFCGLLVNPQLAEYIKEHNLPFEPYSGFRFGMKKNVSDEVENRIRDYAKTPVFIKTSCLLAYSHNLEHDYNCHYYRPGETRCNQCVMKEKCMAFRNRRVDKLPDNIKIPFDYRIEHVDKMNCAMLPQCDHPSRDCTQINGTMIVVDEPVTIGDIRIMRWLTGLMVRPKTMTWNDFISDKWII